MKQELESARSPALAVTTSELDTQIMTAKSYPRNVAEAIKEAELMVGSSKEIAESCNYSLQRKSKGNVTYITGPSVRLAEIFCQCWGNLHAATRIISNDKREVVAEAVAWDLEKNIKIVTESRRSILTREKQTYSPDMQAVTSNAAASIALRNAIFRVIPKAYVDVIYNKALSFARQDVAKNLAEKRQTAIDYFKSHDYLKDHILKFLNKKTTDEITKDDIIMLAGIKNRIEDGLLDGKKSLPLTESDYSEKPTDTAKEFFGDDE